MNTTEQGIILLLKSAITGEAYPLPEGFQLEEASPIIKKQGIDALCYIGAVNCGFDKQLLAMKLLFQAYCRQLLQSEGQLAEIQRLYEAFEAQGIDFMPVKGCNMKLLYPAPELRTMGDADILIRMEQYPQIEQVMQSLDFTFQYESNHELVWASKRLMAELHKRLMPSYNKDYYRYYADGWKLAAQHDGHHYYMTDEDQFVYIFTHFAKHFRDGGVGSRQILDLWVYLRHYPNMDMHYIENSMKQLQLDEFYTHILEMLGTWFGGKPASAMSEFITDFVFSGGVWGTAENHASAKGVRYNETALAWVPTHFRPYVRAIFHSPEEMKMQYPILKKYPILLPFSWPYFWVETLLFRHDAIRRCVAAAEVTSEESVERYDELLSYVGLQFRFKQE